MHKFRVVTVPSTQEYQLLAKFAPKYEQKMIIPNCMALTDFATVTAQEGMEKVCVNMGFLGCFKLDFLVFLKYNPANSDTRLSTARHSNLLIIL